MKFNPFLLVTLIVLTSCHNPFAPPLGTESDAGNTSSRNQVTIEGFYEAFKTAYRVQDTTLYGQLLDDDFQFSFYDFDRGIDVSWGRSEDMKTTAGLFRNSEQLELEWSYFRDYRVDSVQAILSRAFTLRVVFSSVDVVQGDGIARFQLGRPTSTSPWKLVRWTDESNF